VERETLPDLVADGAVAAYLEDGYWLDIGTLEAYAQAQEDMANSTYASPALPRTIRSAEQN
jgi:mannose-1-phosphate guanylyltransferase